MTTCDIHRLPGQIGDKVLNYTYDLSSTKSASTKLLAWFAAGLSTSKTIAVIRGPKTCSASDPSQLLWGHSRKGSKFMELPAAPGPPAETSLPRTTPRDYMQTHFAYYVSVHVCYFNYWHVQYTCIHGICDICYENILINMINQRSEKRNNQIIVLLTD